ncbi:alpha/beta hydrolase [Streptomyces sp. NPDC058372]|uniref:alpha/beta hydrolase n=1 Tax=Streptomyces sp. NPDC058372 TaxID=3346464 RepID=UPI00366921D0
MNRRALALCGAAVSVAALVPAAPSAAAPAAPAAPPAIRWSDCATKAHPTLQCGTVEVPLDHARPDGRRITLALSRVPHTAPTSQGPLLVNPGGPGGSGLSLAGHVATALPEEVAGQYDVIGFDPRGVGRSRPALDCRPGHFAAVRPPSLPLTRAGERANTDRAAAFAAACGERHGDLLPHLDTRSAARDLDVIRAALGAPRISYLGYSYGTYLGAVYAKLFPERVRRLALDSAVDPDGVWYTNNLAQDYAFEDRHRAFLAWVARHDAVYGLGTDPAVVEGAWSRMLSAVAADPAAGTVGAAELEDTFLPGGYYDGYWPRLATAFAAYAKDGESAPLVAAYRALAEGDASGDNGYSVYTAVQCRDAGWPRRWSQWRADAWRVHAKAPFLAWNNTWYNAPCASWPVPALAPPDVTNAAIPPALILQATGDAATPYEGAVSLHRKLRGSSLVVEEGGGNHGVTLGGNDCLDQHLARYLADGTVPSGSGTGEADATCAPLPEPRPAVVKATTRAVPERSDGQALHGLLPRHG